MFDSHFHRLPRGLDTLLLATEERADEMNKRLVMTRELAGLDLEGMFDYSPQGNLRLLIFFYGDREIFDRNREKLEAAGWTWANDLPANGNPFSTEFTKGDWQLVYMFGREKAWWDKKAHKPGKES